MVTNVLNRACFWNYNCDAKHCCSGQYHLIKVCNVRCKVYTATLCYCLPKSETTPFKPLRFCTQHDQNALGIEHAQTQTKLEHAFHYSLDGDSGFTCHHALGAWRSLRVLLKAINAGNCRVKQRCFLSSFAGAPVALLRMLFLLHVEFVAPPTSTC